MPTHLIAIVVLACLAAAATATDPYHVFLISRAASPVIAFPNSSAYPQLFNPSWVQASAGTKNRQGLLIRAQNCSDWTPGQCQNCNVDAHHPISPYFPGSVLLFAEMIGVDGHTFAPPYLVFAPEAGAPQDETLGTEDPRLEYDPATGLYHLFYTCYGKALPVLCHARTADPTIPYPGAWERLGAVFGNRNSKSGALLVSAAPSVASPHVLFWGDSSIALATSPDLVTFTTVNESFLAPRPDQFDSLLVESGPPPGRLDDGNIFFVYNSATVAPGGGSGFGQYSVGFVILNGSNPSQILQRSTVPLLQPKYDWEIGRAPAQCNVHDVVFVEAMRKIGGCSQSFQLYFGGADAVIGTATVVIHPTVGAASDSC